MLGELSPRQRDEFEEHYFCCPECAEEVRLAAMFRDNARSVFAEEGKPARGPRVAWMRPAFAASMAVAAALLAVAGYQVQALRVRLAEATAPQAVASFPLRTVSRGDDQVIAVPKQSRFFTVFFEVSELFPYYLCEIQTESGSKVLATTAPGPPAGDPVSLLLESSRFRSGRYVMLVRGMKNMPESSAGAEIHRLHFVVMSK